ncbi:TPA: hypothetical protein EYQ19_00105 [Candidatus Pacearchaeota archaeon]|jgi:hypothetical protein|nr:hypothetical protein [Candidatus Pacearchaeota archaeon]
MGNEKNINFGEELPYYNKNFGKNLPYFNEDSFSERENPYLRNDKSSEELINQREAEAIYYDAYFYLENPEVHNRLIMHQPPLKFEKSSKEKIEELDSEVLYHGY